MPLVTMCAAVKETSMILKLAPDYRASWICEICRQSDQKCAQTQVTPFWRAMSHENLCTLLNGLVLTFCCAYPSNANYCFKALVGKI